MFGSAKFGVNAYNTVGVETGVAAASPHKLIVMLYEGVLVSLANAQKHMTAGNVAEKGQCISKAVMIIDSGLRSSLDMDAGGQIAQNLDSLYEYMTSRLIEANLNNSEEIIQEIYNLLLDLKNTWEAIAEAPTQKQAASPAAPRQQNAYDQLSPRSTSVVRA